MRLSTSLLVLAALTGTMATAEQISVGPRPYYLIDKMAEGPLKDRLAACADQPVKRTSFSIAHRGAPMFFPEHTVESNMAAWRMGTGVMECDVAFTKDHELVCRHAQNDLHTTTNILATPLASTCVTPFTPAADGQPAKAECRTSEITLEEFRTLAPKMDSADKTATTVEAYMGGNPAWRSTLFAADAPRTMTHAESIELFKSFGVKMTPELKDPAVEMPHDGFTMDDYADKLIAEYKAAGVAPADFFPQSFNLEVVRHWLETEPEFAANTVYLVELEEGFDEQDPSTWPQDFAALKAMGLTYLAPSLNMLVTVGDDKEIAPSAYAKAATEAGLKLITWSLERSGPLTTGGGWYYSTISDIIHTDGQMYELVDVLAQDVGVVGIFSDWPGTVSYYASCMGLE